MQLDLTNVVNVSVSEAGLGVGAYNTSNIALFTRDTAAPSFGSLGYNIYVAPTQVGIDFGTDSETFKMANAVFSQQPNILANQGYLVVIPFEAGGTPTQEIDFSAVATFGAFKLNYNGTDTGFLDYNCAASDIQTALNLIEGLEDVTVSLIVDAVPKFLVTFTGVSGDIALLTTNSNTLQDSLAQAVTLTVTAITSNETLGAAVTRTQGLVQYFGIMASEISNQVNMLAAAAIIQALNKIAFFVQRDPASVQPGGTLDLLTTGSFSQNRGLFYGSDNDSDALVMMASYAGRGLSTNFDGSNTTQNMHLKTLAGVQPDPSMTQSLLTLCQNAGADAYVSLQGVSKVFASGANHFFDQVYNLRWFVGDIQVTLFNILATAGTKIPQTENGMSLLKGGVRQVCEQGVTNQYLAPGAWTSSTTFGNPADLIRNVSERGYYIFSAPVSQQSPTARAARQATLIQVAAKEAGAIDSAVVIVNINP